MTTASNIRTLGINNEEVVTHDKVREAYRILAKNVHPDVHTIPSRKLDAMNKFIKIKNAHDELLDYIDQNGPIHASIFDFSSEEPGETAYFNDNRKAQHNERMRQRAQNIFHETRLDKFFFKMPWFLLFGPSIFITYLTAAIAGMAFFGLPGLIVHVIGKAIYKDDWSRVAEKYIGGPLLFISPLLIYVLPILVSAEFLNDGFVNWTQVYVWWILITPTAIFQICKQIESLFIVMKAKRSLSLM